MKSIERNIAVVETVYLDVFIIPNPADKLSTFTNHSMEEICYELKEVGLRLDVSDRMVQVWVTDIYAEDNLKHKDNWCSGYPTHGDGEADQQKTQSPKTWTRKTEYSRVYPTSFNFPAYLPADLFKGKVERESVTLITEEGVKYVLRLNQKCYRYRSQGLFEKVLEHVVAIGC